MDRTTNDLSKYTLHKTIVDCLGKDGVICNSNTKDYNEQETLKGGSGFRLSFTKYNTKISDYHTLLKVLSGEQRANITESIPVIDFLDNSNTSLLYTYDSDETSGTQVLDVTSIHSADEEGSTPLELIEKEDPFIINRALAGEDIAKYFYNTNGTPSEPSVQVSPWLGNDFTECVFNGIISNPLIINGSFYDTSLISDSFKSSYIPSTSDESNIMQVQLLEAYAKEGSTFSEDLKNKNLNFKLVTPELIRNGECKVGNEIFITTDSSAGKYNIDLSPEDVVILLPQSNYGSSFSQLFIFKYLNDNQAVPKDALTYGPYKYRNSNRNSDNDSEFIYVEDSISGIKSAQAGDTYFLKSYPYGAMYVEEGNTNLISAPEEFTPNSNIRCIESFSEGGNSKNKWESSGSSYDLFVLPVSYYSSSIYLTTTSPGSNLPSYLKRTDIYNIIQSVLGIEKIYTSEASGLLDGLYSEPYETSSNSLGSTSEVVNKWKFINETPLASSKNTSIAVGSKYFSGHLLNRGFFFSSPLRLTSNDYKNPETGAIETPKLTLSDGAEINCKGKLSHVYQVFSTAVSKLFKDYQVDDFSNFPLRPLDEVITKADLKERSYTNNEAKDLLGITDNNLGTSGKYAYSSKLNYSQKFSSYIENADEGACEESFITYFENMVSGIDSPTGTLTLNLTKGENCVYARSTRQATVTTVKETQEECCQSKKETQSESTNYTYCEGDTSSFNRLYSDPNINYAINYRVTLGDIKVINDHGNWTTEVNESTYKIKEGTSLQNISIKFLTPLEALSTKGLNTTKVASFLYNSEDNSSSKRVIQSKKAPKGTVLVYPEYSKTLPHTLFLISNEDLQLDPQGRSLVSFLSKPSNSYPNSVVSFKVSAKYKYAPSEIRKVKLITSDTTQLLDYPNGLAPKVYTYATGVVSGFTTVALKASLYDYYNGNYTVEDDGFRISVSWKDVIDGKFRKDTSTNIIVSSNTGTPYSSNSLRASSKLRKASRLTSLIAEMSEIEDYQEEEVASSNSLSSQKNLYGVDSLRIPKDENLNYTSLEDNILSSNFKGENTRKNIGGKTKALSNVNIKKFSPKKFKNYNYTYESKLQEILMGSSSSDIKVSGINWNMTQSNSHVWYDREDFGSREDYINYLSRIGEDIYINVPTYTLNYSYQEVPDTSFDCYIYILEDVKISTDSIKLYDQSDKEINTAYSGGVKLIPVSYPSDFFAISTVKNTNGSDTNRLRNKLHVSSLKDRLIIPGLPKFENKEDLKKIDVGLSSVDLTPLINMIYAEDSTVNKSAQTLLRSSILDILKNFRLTGVKEGDISGASSINPFLLKDLPSLVRGLVDAKPVFQKLSKSSFDITVNGTPHTITEDDLYNLIQIIDTDLQLPAFDYEVTQEYDVEGSTDWESKVGSEEYDEAFKKELKRRLNGIKVKTKEVTYTLRPNLKRIAEEIEIALEGKGNLTAEICDKIDSYLGNNTPSILKIGNGDTYEKDGVSFNLTNNQKEYLSQIENKVINTIFDMSLRAKSLFLEKQGRDFLNSFKDVYKKYYTSDSVDEVITNLDYMSYNNSESLIFPNSKSTTELSSYIRDAFQTTYTEAMNSKKEKVYWPSYNYIGPGGRLIQMGMAYREHYITYYVNGWSYSTYSIAKKTHDHPLATIIDEFKIDLSDEEAKKVLSEDYYFVRSRILVSLRGIVQNNTLSLIQEINTTQNTSLPTIEQITDYLSAYNPNNSESYNYFYNFLGLNSKLTAENGIDAVDLRISVILPSYDPSKSVDVYTPSYVDDDTWREDIRNYEPGEDENVLSQCLLTVFNEERVDVEYPILRGINSYIRTSLEGTGTSNYYAKYVEGDNALEGRKNSLYYKRYQMLNNRMNYIEGTLSPLFSLLKSSKYFENQQKYVDNLDESYSRFLSVTPISKMEELTWMPAQQATSSTIELPGKFYYSAALEAMKAQINSQCVLTCSRCSVQKDCPFYDENEIIKMYVPAAEFIDLYFKDNELDLLAYPEEVTSEDIYNGKTTIQYPYVYTEDSEGQRDYLNIDKLKESHLLYRDILRKVTDSSKKDSFVGRDITKVREELRKAPNFIDEINGEALGYLLGGRYGTVSRNNMALLANKDSNFKEFNGVKIPEYQYLYNTIYIKDTESYINYATSDLSYDVSFEMGPLYNKKKYIGKVKIKEPVSLKSLSEADSSDHVYLVSDDTCDENGNRICPVIYLGQVGSLKYNFGMIMDPNKSIQDPEDTNIYASDVAQWCVNYYKGFLTEDPLEDIGDDPSSPSKDIELDHDQYWMPELKKKVYDSTLGQEKWITLGGRPRESAKYSEPLMDPDNLDEVTVASGKPVTANYINFLRKVSIRIYDDSKVKYDEAGNYNEQDAWCIPWVKDINFGESKTLKDGTIIDWNTQRAALSYMKTNLRLVVVKS